MKRNRQNKQSTPFWLAAFLLPLSACSESITPSLSFDFPSLAGKDIQCYYYEGNKVDTLSLRLDPNGKGEAIFPANYQGYVQIVNESFYIEGIVGEENARIESADQYPTADNARFVHSPENDFFSSMMKKLQEEQPTADTQKTLETSPLYAARFIEINEFVKMLFQPDAQPTPERTAYIKDYLLNRMNWEALYTAGPLWRLIHNYHIYLFNDENPERPLPETQRLYAAAVISLLQKTKDPYRAAIAGNAIDESEGLRWTLAKRELDAFIAKQHIPIDSTVLSKSIQIAAGVKAPAIEGMSDLSKKVVIFYNSACGHCVEEMTALKTFYPALQAQGYEVVSVSADTEEEAFQAYIQDFPWEYKLCDFTGFGGKTFEDYGVMLTPAFFVVDKNGVITGRYTEAEELQPVF